MRKIIFAFLCAISLSSCDNAPVPDDANVYIVDSSAVFGQDYLQLNLRDVDDPVMVPLANCDDVFYPRGTIVLIDEDFKVWKTDQKNPVCFFVLAALSFLVIVLTFLKKRKTPQ